MQPQSAQDYKQLLTDVIKKQIVILGPDITLSKARNVKGLTVQNDGTVTEVTGSPQEVTQALIDQFVQLSGLIVKKTMEPLLLLNQPAAPVAPTTLEQPSQVPPAPQISVVQPQPSPVTVRVQGQPVPISTPVATPQAEPTAQQQVSVPVEQPQQQATNTVPAPAENPLAA